MLLALAVAIISDISMIQCPCILRYTFSSSSYDGGSTWDTSPTVELPDFYSYEEFAGWIETESDNLQALVAAGELTQEEAAAAIAQYQSALSGIEDGVQVGKRSSYEEDQIFFSMPNNPQSEVFRQSCMTVTVIGTLARIIQKLNCMRPWSNTQTIGLNLEI